MVGTGIIKKDIDFLEDLSIVSMLRGTHSTGVWKSSSFGKKPSSLARHNTDVIGAFGVNPTLLGDIQNTVFMSHVRHATVGDISEDNVHPFEYDDFVACHNGTLVDPEYNDKDSQLTDSQQFFDKLDSVYKENKGSLQDTLADLLSSLDPKSAYAMTVYCKKDDSVLFVHNSKRPLAFAHSDVRKVMYYASEADMLEWLLVRNGVSYSEVLRVAENKVLRLPANKVNAVKTEKDAHMFYIKGFTPKKTTSTVVKSTVEKNGQQSFLMADTTHCVTCRKPMDHLDRQDGTRLHDGRFTCSECDQNYLGYVNQSKGKH